MTPTTIVVTQADPIMPGWAAAGALWSILVFAVLAVVLWRQADKDTKR